MNARHRIALPLLALTAIAFVGASAVAADAPPPNETTADMVDDLDRSILSNNPPVSYPDPTLGSDVEDPEKAVAPNRFYWWMRTAIGTMGAALGF